MEKKIEITVNINEAGTGFTMTRKFENLSCWEIIGILKQELLLAEVMALEEYDASKNNVSQDQTNKPLDK